MVYIKRLYVFAFIFVIIFLFLNFNREDKKYVYVLGNVVGIKATTDGVLVLDYEEDDIEYTDKLKKGDRILYINDQKIKSSQNIYDILNKLKSDTVDITFERDGKIIKKSIKTKEKEGIYKLGLWVRDKISGIGTMTCYDFQSGLFYAVGHPICDFDIDKLLKINKGNIYNLSDIKISKANDDKIGEIKGNFESKNEIGYFSKNFDYGIEGDLREDLFHIDENRILEIASFDEIKSGKADILFELEKNKASYYDIYIGNIDQKTQSFEIEIIDKNLINYTGGIIKGMSGSPIIQNGKIIGAVTHVLSNKPTKGYGISIENMMKYSD